MVRLEELASGTKKRKRIGRGGSRGGTSGRGHKGQKARSGGGTRPGFEGGQMPLYRRLPEHGFTNARFKTVVEAVNIGRFADMFDEGTEITKVVLLERGIIKPKKAKPFLLKILADGDLTKKLTIVADLFSKGAQKKIEEVGGKAVLIQEK